MDRKDARKMARNEDGFLNEGPEQERLISINVGSGVPSKKDHGPETARNQQHRNSLNHTRHNEEEKNIF